MAENTNKYEDLFTGHEVELDEGEMIIAQEQLQRIGKDLTKAFRNLFVDIAKPSFTPSRIMVNGPATVVFWNDGTKTVVKCAKDETPSVYTAFTAAMGIKLFGSNSALKKVINDVTFEQMPKKKKEGTHKK